MTDIGTRLLDGTLSIRIRTEPNRNEQLGPEPNRSGTEPNRSEELPGVKRCQFAIFGTGKTVVYLPITHIPQYIN